VGAGIATIVHHDVLDLMRELSNGRQTSGALNIEERLDVMA
jgi:hypothetical protein